MPMNIKLIGLFAKWLFMKTFNGCFKTAEKWRDMLQYETGLAILLFVLVSGLSFVAVGLISAFTLGNREVISYIVTSYFGLIVFTFLYNVFKVLWTNFIQDRSRLFEILKDSK